MKKITFFLFLLTVLLIFMLIPEQLLNKELLSLDTLTSPKSQLLDMLKDKTPDEVYQEIYDALINLEDEIYIGTSLTSDEVFDIREQVIKDNPEVFYLDYETSTYWSNGKLEFKYMDSKDNILEQKAMISAKVDYVLEQIIKPDMTELEKELAIHDYIVLNTQYDVVNFNKNTIPNPSYNINGILLNGIGVCEGYAKTFKLMLDRVGIESTIVEGPKINHAWNIVKIDNQYYHVDVTWDDPVPDRRGKVSHSYFNVSDRNLSKGEHIWDKEAYPKCSSEQYSNMLQKR